MIYAFVPNAGGLQRVSLATGEVIPENAIWLDLVEPSREEEDRVEKALGQDVPTREEMQEIEVSSRLYTAGEAAFMTATVLSQADTALPQSTAVTFILTRRHLVSLRYTDPRPFGLFANRICKQPVLARSSEITLVGLLEAIVDRAADVLERVSNELDSVSHAIFAEDPERLGQQGPRDLRKVMFDIGRNGDLASKVHESLVSLTRLNRFFAQATDSWGNKELKNRIKTLNRDLGSLSEYATYESHKVNFLLDATLGVLNIEQNNIIKIFTVAAVALMPPTLIASIYGMNFKHIPELEWIFGYPMAIVLMIGSAALPYYFFKRKGWL
jgi:magnesium transporter